MSFDPETARLTFHRQTEADFTESAALWADAGTTRFIGGVPSPADESWARLLRNAGHWALLGYGFWAIRDRQTGQFMGEVGAKQFRRGLDPALELVPETGWVLAPWAHGRGLATEAAQAVLAWGEATFGWDLTVCIVDPGNAASIGVAQKCGYVDSGRVDFRQSEVILFRRGLAGAAPN